MGVDYTVEVVRNVDGKRIAEFFANQLKCIMDSHLDKIIHCDHRSADKAEFTFDELVLVEETAMKEIGEKYGKIFENKLLMPRSKTSEIKREYEEDNQCLLEEITELGYVASAASFLQGMIECVTEDLLKKGKNGKPAYEYNGADLPKEQREYGNGQKYECSQTVWVRDVHCVIHANY